MRLLRVPLLLLCPVVLSAQSRRPLIAIGGISHESNSFNPAKTTYADFRQREVTSIDQALREWARTNDEVSGYIEGARQYGLELYPALVAGAAPKGPVTDEAFEQLLDELLKQLMAAPKLDGLLLANHGAMVVESYPHGDAEMVKRLRKMFGPSFPIVVTHDFHANVSEQIVKGSTVLITYKENPHLDTKERGLQAARIMAEIVKGRVKPVQAIVKPPMVYSIVYQHTKRDPLLPIVEESRRLEKHPKVLAASVSGGYQYADVPAMGPSVIVVTDNDPALAQDEAQRLSDMLWATRERILLRLPEPADAVKQAMESSKFPVVLMDMGDNIGGGSAGDSTFILTELLKQKAEGWVMTIADREAAQAAFRAGVGNPFDMRVGGKTDKLHGEPVQVGGRVKSLHDGKYIETEIRHGGGRYYDMGFTAVIEVRGSTHDLPNLLLLTTERSSPNSLHQLISNGVYPERQKILVAKGAIAPRAAYEPIAGRIIEVDSGGVTAVNPARFVYGRVRRPLLGLDR